MDDRLKDTFSNKRRPGEKWEQNVRKESERAQKKIVLDVGGTKFSTTRDTLLGHHRFGEQANFFTMMLSGAWKAEEDGTYFIDRNPSNFEIVLEYFRTGILRTKHLDDDQLEIFKMDLDFYQIPVTISQEKVLDLNSKIINQNQAEILKKWLPVGKTFGDLLYQKSDGDTFHQKCNGKGATVVIFETGSGWIQGGFAAHDWDPEIELTAGSGFLFTLSNRFKCPPSKFDVSNNKRAQQRREKYPCFGAGWIRHPQGPEYGGTTVYDLEMTGEHLTAEFPTGCYQTTIKNKIMRDSDGELDPRDDDDEYRAPLFKVSNVEVFQVIDEQE